MSRPPGFGYESLVLDESVEAAGAGASQPRPPATVSDALIAQMEPTRQRRSRPVDVDYESRELREVEANNYRGCWFSRQEPYGEIFATAAGARLDVWSVASSRCIGSVALARPRTIGGDGAATAAAPSRKIFCVGSTSGSVMVYGQNFEEGEAPPLRWEKPVHEKECVAVAFNPEGNLVASASLAGQVAVIDVQTQAPVAQLDLGGNIGKKRASILFSATLLVVGSSDQCLARVWNVKGGRRGTVAPAPAAGGGGSRKHRRKNHTHDDVSEIVDRDFALQLSLRGDDRAYRCIALRPGRQSRVACGTEAGEVALLDLSGESDGVEEEELLVLPQLHGPAKEKAITALAYTCESASDHTDVDYYGRVRLAVAQRLGRVTLFDMDTRGKHGLPVAVCIACFDGQQSHNSGHTLAFSLNNSILATGGGDGRQLRTFAQPANHRPYSHCVSLSVFLRCSSDRCGVHLQGALCCASCNLARRRPNWVLASRRSNT